MKVDEQRAIKIARKAFGLTLTSMPDELYVLITEAIKDEQERIIELCETGKWKNEPCQDLPVAIMGGAK